MSSPVSLVVPIRRFDDAKSRRKVLDAAFKVINTGLLEDKGIMGEAMNPVEAEIPTDPEQEPG